MTGTLDKSEIRGKEANSRLLVFPALPAGERYHLVLDKAEHSAFVDQGMWKVTSGCFSAQGCGNSWHQ